MNMHKKTWAIWAISGIISVSILLEIWSLVIALAVHKPLFPGNAIINAIALAMLPIDLALSTIFLVKLQRITDDLPLWTNITFGYAVVMQAYATLADGFGATPWALTTPNIIELCFIFVLWMLFRLHLDKHSEAPSRYLPTTKL